MNGRRDISAAKDLVSEVGGLLTQDLEFDGVAQDGVSGGAVYVRRPDGRPGVITFADPPIERMRVAAGVLDRARALGVPVPRHEAVLPLADGRIVVVQERLPGNPIRRVDVPLLERVVAVNDRFAGLVGHRPDVPAVRLDLRQSPPDHPRHETLAGHSDRTRSILARITAIGQESPDELPGDDLVHSDFARGNVLVDDNGEITGVVDWSAGAMRGDRAFALVSLRSDLEWRAYYDSWEWVSRESVEWMDATLRARIEPSALLAYWAHWTLHKVYASIWMNDARQIEMWLDLGEAWLY